MACCLFCVSDEEVVNDKVQCTYVLTISLQVIPNATLRTLAQSIPHLPPHFCTVGTVTPSVRSIYGSIRRELERCAVHGPVLLFGLSCLLALCTLHVKDQRH